MDPSCDPACDRRNHAYAATTVTSDGAALAGRRRAVRVPAGVRTVLHWDVRTAAGAPVNLELCPPFDEVEASLGASTGAGPAFALLLRDSVGPELTGRLPAEVEDAAAGKLLVELPPTIPPGIYDAAFVTGDAASGYGFADELDLVVESAPTWGDNQGPPTLAELRLHLADVSGLENEPFDVRAFDDAQLAAAIRRPVELWNAEPPFIATYSVATFPARFRGRWLDAIVGHLYLTAAHNPMRNYRQINAAGLSVSGPDRGPMFLQVGQQMVAEYRQWVATAKRALNVQRGYGGIGSRYGRPWR